jgi:hypothetical protein
VTSKIESLAEVLTSLRAEYYKSTLTAISHILEHEFDLCVGNCGRVVYPKDQWVEVPEHYRKKLNTWIIEHAGFGMCPACYRREVRGGKVSPVPRKRILDPDELKYLRRQVGLPSGE